MSQADFSIANQLGPDFRAEVNTSLQALVTQNSGATAPATTYPYMIWMDSSTTPSTVKQRNGANNAWITLYQVDSTDLILPGALNLGNGAFRSTTAGQFALSHTNPKFVIYESDQASDQKLWDINAASGLLLHRTRTDADGSGTTWLSVARSGTSVGDINFVTNSGSFAFTGGSIKIDTIAEKTAAAGITADGVLLKDSTILVNQGSNTATDYVGAIIQNSANTLRTGFGAYGMSNKVGSSQTSDFTMVLGSELIIDAGDGLRIGSAGTPFKAVYSATASLDFGSIPANSSADLTITVTGATTSNRDDVGVGLAAGPNAGLIYQGFVSAADTVTIRACNFTVGAINPTAQTIRATVTQY